MNEFERALAHEICDTAGKDIVDGLKPTMQRNLALAILEAVRVGLDTRTHDAVERLQRAQTAIAFLLNGYGA